MIAARHHIKSIALIAIVMVAITSCKIQYGFKSGPTEAYVGKDLYIKQFETFATLAPPTLSLTFTETLRDIYQRQSRMKLVDNPGDMNFEGAIVGYEVRPVAITSNEAAANNRLTISVKVTCVNKVVPDGKGNFEQTFSRFADFDANQQLSAVESALIEEINDQIAQDIFNRSIGDW